MQCYLVGGAIRDMLLGTTPHEFDIVFAETVEDFLYEKPHAKRIGTDVPIFIAEGHEFIPLQGSSINDDLMSRDFTINALATDENGVLHMHAKALGDLKKGILRPVSGDIFQSDPLRVFRAARFAATFPHFSLHADLPQMMRDRKSVV